MGKIILDKEFDYRYYRESLIYCITNSRNKTEWMQVIHIGYRNRKPLYLFNDVKERYIAARRLGVDIGFQASDQFRYLLINSVK